MLRNLGRYIRDSDSPNLYVFQMYSKPSEETHKYFTLKIIEVERKPKVV